MVPSNPEKNYFGTAGAIMNLVSKKSWSEESLFTQVSVFCALINYLVTQVQDRLPYSIVRVDSNDSIFLGDEDFAHQAQTIIDQVYEKIIDLCASNMDN